MRFVSDVEAGEKFIEPARVADWNNVVRFAVNDECRWEGAGCLGGIGLDEAAGEIDESTYAAAGCWIG